MGEASYYSVNKNLMLGFFAWWYTSQFIRVLLIIRYLFIRTWDNFSIGLLFKSLLAPWRKDVLGGKGLSLNEKLQVAIMNVMSRVIGFFMRSVVILAGLLFCLTLFILSCAGLIFYLLVPPGLLGLIFYGIIIMFT
jgi:hypothetical protein